MSICAWFGRLRRALQRPPAGITESPSPTESPELRAAIEEHNRSADELRDSIIFAPERSIVNVRRALRGEYPRGERRR